MTSIYGYNSQHNDNNNNNNTNNTHNDILISPRGNITDDVNLNNLLNAPTPDIEHNNNNDNNNSQQQLLYNVNGYNNTTINAQNQQTINNSIGSPTNEQQYNNTINNDNTTNDNTTDILWSPRSLLQSVNNAVNTFTNSTSIQPPKQYAQTEYTYPTNSVIAEYQYSAQHQYEHEQQHLLQQTDAQQQQQQQSINSSIPPSLLLPSHNTVPRYQYQPTMLHRRNRRSQTYEQIEYNNTTSNTNNNTAFTDMVECKQEPQQPNVLDAALFATQYEPPQHTTPLPPIYTTRPYGNNEPINLQASITNTSTSSSRTATPMPINSRSNTPHSYTTEYGVKSNFDIQCIDTNQQSYVLIDHYRGRRNYVTTERPYQPNNTTVTKRELDEEYTDTKRLRTKHSHSYAHITTLPNNENRYELRSVSEPQFDNNQKPNYYESSPETVTHSTNISPVADIIARNANIVTTNNTVVDQTVINALAPAINALLTPSKKVPTKPKKFTCEQCNKGFTQKGGLLNHVRIHTGERPYKCGFPGCNRSFIQKCNAVRHEKCHTGEKPFACGVCNKHFNRRWGLLVHYRTHLLQHNINVQKLADELNMNPDQISDIFAGRANQPVMDEEIGIDDDINELDP